MAFVVSALVIVIDFIICWKLVTHDYKEDRFSSILGIVVFALVQSITFMIIKTLFDSAGA